MLYPESGHSAGRVTTPLGDLRHLETSGALPARAADVGARLKDSIRRGSVPFMSRYLESYVRRSRARRLARTIDWGAYNLATRRMRSHLPEEWTELVYALADSSGVAPSTFFRAFLAPETLLWLTASFSRRSRVPGLAPDDLGATSAVTMGPDGPLHARTLDSVGVNYFERYATVCFHQPDEGLAHVGVGSAGRWGAGSTGMNEAGLTLAAHQHLIERLDLGGVPAGPAAHAVLSRASTIEEALEVLRELPVVGGWSYVLTEGDTGRVARVELAPGREHVLVRDASEGLAHTNLFGSRALAGLELDVYPQRTRHHAARARRARHAIDSLEAPGARDLVAALCEPLDADGDTRLFGPTLSSVHTVCAVVFEPRARRVWVGAGRSPSTRGWFVPFSLDRRAPDTSASPFCVDPGWRETPHGSAFELYRQAYYRFLEGDDANKVSVPIEHALALAPFEPNLHVLAGLLALRSGRGKRAEGALRRALQMTTEPARRAELGLFIAWSLDVQNRHLAARSLASQILSNASADYTTRTHARRLRSIRRYMTPSRAADLPVDFVHAGSPSW